MSETEPNNDYQKGYSDGFRRYHNINELQKKMKYRYTVGLVILVFVIFVLISTYMYNRSCIISRNNNLLDMVTIYSTDSSNLGRLSSDSFSF